MKITRTIKVIPIVLAGLAVVPALALARTYQVSGPGYTFVDNPGLAAQYNGKLNGAPKDFEFKLDASSTVGITIAVPDKDSSPHDVSAEIIKDATTIASLDAQSTGWDTTYVDTETSSTYRAGASITSLLGPGSYTVRISSKKNNSDYAIRFDEHSTPRATADALRDQAPQEHTYPWAIYVGLAAVLIAGIAVFAKTKEKAPSQH